MLYEFKLTNVLGALAIGTTVYLTYRYLSTDDTTCDTTGDTTGTTTGDTTGTTNTDSSG